jgi:phenylacetate-CoA ligase
MIYNRETETLPRNDLAQLQIERLQTTLNRVYRNVAFYREAFDRQRVDIEKIRSIDDLQRLPFTTKDDLRRSYPYGMFAVPLRDIVRLHASSGTTGQPIVVGYTRNDLNHWSEVVARTLFAAGVTEHDVVQIAFQYSLFTGGLGFHYGAERIGASVIPASSHTNATEQVMIMRDYKTSVLITMPSHALALAEARDQLHLHPEALQLKIGIFGAEPWTEETRRHIEERLHITAYDAYGLTEIIGPGIAGECAQRTGLHINEDHFIAEVINPQTLAPVSAGETGELVFTTLTKEGFPLIRYRTGDRASLDPAPCACGRTLARMSRVTGRTDDLLMIRGIKLFPTQLQEIAQTMGGIAPQMRVVLSRVKEEETLEIQVAFADDFGDLDEVRHVEQMRRDFAQRVENTIGITPKIVFLESATLHQSCGAKNLRVVDLRKV